MPKDKIYSATGTDNGAVNDTEKRLLELIEQTPSITITSMSVGKRIRSPAGYNRAVKG